jgi:hypothetical protein
MNPFYWIMALCHFQLYFSYIVAVSFIGGGTGVPGETTDLPQVTDKLDHISSERDSNSQLLVAIGTD